MAVRLVPVLRTEARVVAGSCCGVLGWSLAGAGAGACMLLVRVPRADRVVVVGVVLGLSGAAAAPARPDPDEGAAVVAARGDVAFLAVAFELLVADLAVVVDFVGFDPARLEPPPVEPPRAERVPAVEEGAA